MKIKISRNKTSARVYLQKSFRDRSGKSTTKNVCCLGTLEEIRERYGCADPLEWAREYARKKTLEENEMKKEVTVRLMPERVIPKEERQGCRGGYLFLQRIYHRLGLDRICKAIEKKHRFDYDLDAALRLMVFGRIIDPRSKRATHREADTVLERIKVGPQHLYRSLDVLSGDSDYIQKRLYKNSLSFVKRDTTVLYYDCTNYFFETEKADPVTVDREGKRKVGLRQYGVSKEHRPNPIVQMGLFIDNTGFPLAMCINPGNTNEQTTLVPTEKLIVERMGLERIVVCTDGGLSSEDNRSYNSTANRSFITVQSLKKLPAVYQEWALSADGWMLVPFSEAQKAVRRARGLPDDTDCELVFDLTKDETARLYGDRTFFRERWIVNEGTGFSQRLIVTFSYKYRDYLRALRLREIEVARRDIQKGCSGKRRSRSPQRFISEAYATDEGEVAVYKTMALNLDAIEQEEMFDGFYGICTDLNNDVDQILRMNHNRWESEDAFRVLKTDFKARPTFVWTDEHIRGHFMVCFIALLIFRILESELEYKYTSSEILETLRGMWFSIIKGEGFKPSFTRTDLTDALHECAGFRLDTELVTNQKLKEIMKIVKDS